MSGDFKWAAFFKEQGCDDSEAATFAAKCVEGKLTEDSIARLDDAQMDLIGIGKDLHGLNVRKGILNAAAMKKLKGPRIRLCSNSSVLSITESGSAAMIRERKSRLL